ncbi:ATP synthase epsilon chain [bacterium BMS3Abin01]|nr:ATP synthase epsilon chain [bacterium BMS3Abin01]HDY69581.1 ATP synthase F1 subunit epsilon [Actinomycetota bacterium]
MEPDITKKCKLKCEIVTPEGLKYDDCAIMVVVPGKIGELGILPRHAPIVSRTVIGKVIVMGEEGSRDRFAVGDGYVKVQYDRLLLTVDTAERASEIDVERSRKALVRAEEWMEKARHGDSSVDTNRAYSSMHRARNRLKVAGAE